MSQYPFLGLGFNSWTQKFGRDGGQESGISSDQLTLRLDANNSNSNPGSGTTWFDLTSNNIDVTLINGATFATSSGISYVEFDGSDDFAETSANSNLAVGTSDFTYTAWVYFNVGTSIIFSTETSLQNGFVFYKTGRQLRVTDYVPSANQPYVSPTEVLPDFNWHNVVIKRSSSTYTVYLNGSQVGSTWSNSRNYTHNKILLGSFTPNNNINFDGRLGAFSLYHRALSDDEVLTDYNANKGTYGL